MDIVKHFRWHSTALNGVSLHSADSAHLPQTEWLHLHTIVLNSCSELINTELILTLSYAYFLHWIVKSAAMRIIVC